MKASRRTGLLLGKPVPKFTKMGDSKNASVRYQKKVLDEFLDQFQEYQTTAEY